MKLLKLKTTVYYAFLCLFLVSNVAFATDDDEEEDSPSTTGATTEECGFFCSIGEFFEDLFTTEDPC